MQKYFVAITVVVVVVIRQPFGELLKNMILTNCYTMFLVTLRKIVSVTV